jgi:tetratricopeptide (TPR) repeat protein
MSDVNWRLFTRRRDHTFQPPVPEMTAKYGVPNACTTCHEDKTPEWAAKTMDAWYGNGDRRRAVVTLADAMYRAGTGDVGALPDVARLAVDRSRGTLIRASAAEFVGQLLEKASTMTPPARIDPGVVNALIGAAADPEPQVRTMAVRALAFVREPRILPVLAARLDDEARVVRVSAATSITALGVLSLDGAAGQSLARAEDEWAESLATFNDVANDHTTLGWLDSARGRTDEAARELATAVRMDPADPKPHVYLGVLAARAGKFDEALQHFKAAKSLAPSYQNLDRLIEEAQKRAANRP